MRRFFVFLLVFSLLVSVCVFSVFADQRQDVIPLPNIGKLNVLKPNSGHNFLPEIFGIYDTVYYLVPGSYSVHFVNPSIQSFNVFSFDRYNNSVSSIPVSETSSGHYTFFVDSYTFCRLDVSFGNPSLATFFYVDSVPAGYYSYSSFIDVTYPGTGSFQPISPTSVSLKSALSFYDTEGTSVTLTSQGIPQPNFFGLSYISIPNPALAGFLIRGETFTYQFAVTYNLPPGTYKLTPPDLLSGTPTVILYPSLGDVPTTEGDPVTAPFLFSDSDWVENSNVNFDGTYYHVYEEAHYTYVYNWYFSVPPFSYRYFNARISLQNLPTVDSTVSVPTFEWVPDLPDSQNPVPPSPSSSLPPTSDSDININAHALLKVMDDISKFLYGDITLRNCTLNYPDWGVVSLGSDNTVTLSTQLQLEYLSTCMWLEQISNKIGSAGYELVRIEDVLRSINTNLGVGLMGTFENDYISSFSSQISIVEDKLLSTDASSQLNGLSSGILSGDFGNSALGGVASAVSGAQGQAYGLWSQDTVDAFNGVVDDWYDDFESRRNSW